MNHKKSLPTPAHHNPSLGKWFDLFVLLFLCTLLLAINRRAEGSRMADGVIILELARATEGGGNGIVTFRLENGATAPSDITITYTINATAANPAVNGVDYQTLSGTATIAAGTNEAQVIITPIDDILIEGDENIEFTLISALDQGGLSYLTPQRGLVTTLVDNDNRISITKVNNGKELGNGNASDGAYLIKLPGNLTFNEDIPVKYLITGGTTASGGAGTTFDYDNSNLTGTIILPANTNSIQLPLKVNDDKLVEVNENVELTIQDNMLSAVTNIRFSFDPLQKSAIVTIEDDDVNIPIGVVATKDGAEPGGGTNDGSITVGWPDGFTSTTGIVIRYTISGTAIINTDYRISPVSPTQAIISPGTSNIKIPIAVIDDNIVEGTETVVLNITGISFGGGPTSPTGTNQATVNIADNDVKSSVQWKSASYTGTGTGGAVKAGELITYTIHVRNTGNVILTNTKITDVIPANTQFVSADGGIVPDAGGRLTWTIPSIAVNANNEMRSFTVRVVNDLTTVSNITNTADVDNGDGTGDHPTTPPDPNNPNDPHPNPVPNTPSTDIPVDNGGKHSANWKSASYTGTGTGGKLKPGDQITYTVHVRNTGNVRLTNVIISDQLPAYTVFVSADGGITPDASGKLTWTITDIPVGSADVTRNFVVRVAANLTGATSITNTADVDNGDGTGGHPTTSPDPNNPNNPHPNPTPNTPSTDIPIDNAKRSVNWKSASYTGTGANGKLKAGDEIVYTIHIRNTGHVELANVQISDQLPAATSFISADGGIVPDGTGKLTWTISTIGVGAADVTRSFRVRVVTDLTGVTNIINTADVDNGDGTGGHPTTPPDPNNPNDPHPNPTPNTPSTDIPVDNGGKKSANWKSASYTATGTGGRVKPGDQITYTIHVRNTGNVRLTNVTISDQLPAYTVFVSADGGIVPDGTGKLTWTITDIPVGSADVTRSFVVRVASNLTGATSITNTADVDNGDGTGGHPTTPPDPNNPNNPHPNPTPNTPSTDIPVDNAKQSLNWKSAAYTGTGTGGKLKAGDEIIYTIHIRNTGPVELTNVQIGDQLPAATSFISADGGIVPDATGKLTWTIASIPVGSADVLRSFRVRVVTDLTGVTSIVNTADVDNGDGTGGHPTTPPDPNNPNDPHPNPVPNTPSTDIPVDNGGKHSLNWKSASYTATGTGGKLKPGDQISYTIHVRNTGNVRLTNVIISDQLPAYTVFVSADGGIVPDGTGKLTWTITDIPVGSADVTRSFVVRVAANLTGATSITNTADVDNGDGTGGHPTTPPDPNNPNNPHPNPTPNTPSTDIPVDNTKHSLNWKSAAYTGTGTGGRLKAGDEITYTIHIRNTGPVELTNVQIGDQLPAATSFISADGGITPDASGKLTWTIASIPVGSADVVRSFRVRVVTDLTGVTNIVNTADVDNGDGTGGHPTTPPDPNNPNDPHPNPTPNTPSTDIPVDNGGKQSANWKSASYTGSGTSGRVKPGDQITYTIHIRNTGNVRLTNVIISDQLPAYTVFVSADGGIVPDATGKLTWTITDIPVGSADVTRSFVVTVASNLTGATSIVNTADVDNGNGTGGHPTTPPDPGNPNNPHPNPTPNTPSTDIPVDNAKQSLNWKSAAYTGTGTGGRLKAGDEIIYTIHIRNTGPVELTNVQIGDQLPVATSFISADGGIVPDATGKLTWTIASIPVGSADVVRSFRVRVINDLTGVTNIVNTADVDNGDGTGGHPTTPPDPNNPNDPHPNPVPNTPSTDIPVDNGGKHSLNWKSASYTATGTGGRVKPGDQISYTIHIRNTGNVRLTNVIISDQLPAYTVFVSADGGIVPDGTGKLTWTITDIPVGSADVTRSFVVRVAANLTGATSITNTADVDNGDGTGGHPTTPPDPNNPNNPHPNPTPNTPSTDIPVDNMKKSVSWKTAAYTGTGANGKVKAGDEITYTIHIRNTGHVELTNVQTGDQLPAPTSFVSADEGIVPDASGKLTWTIPNIAVGAADVLRSFRVRVANDLSDVTNIVNTADVDNGDGTGGHPTTPPDPDNPNNPHPNPNPNTPSTDIPVDNGKSSTNWKSAAYTGTGTDGAVRTGDEITYTVHIRNTGNTRLTNVLLTDTIPAFTTFVSAEGGIVPDAGKKLTWTISEIPVGSADITRSFTVRVVEDLTGATNIYNTAWVNNGNGNGNEPTNSSDPNDPANPNPNPTPGPSTSIKVDAKQAFAAWKTVATASGGLKAKPGEILLYTVFVRNTGNVTLPAITVIDSVPAHTTYESAGESGIYDRETNRVTWTIRDIPVGDMTPVTFRVKVDNNLDSGIVITNIASVTNGTDTIPTGTCDPSATGCSGTPGTTVIETEEANGGLKFANAMSPNGDGKNDYFAIKGLDKYPGSALYVYNRWGNMVYQSRSYNNDWAATGLSDGTYYYVLELKRPEGTKVYKGWVIIKRD
ncbi:DUF7507 domain-containing protein [Chitinophaga tropicalis]|uniref:DUF11 domain-containing protein n=1 Tax=Chitinophaga tropicalis TaxID=2683588 RepID=A0A7K1U0Q1_9BACT|nr:gliding motility-associated C-terminal domain-containing protein [Chitinophaga tropicalis]MVT07923.1 DUF11 domain-containing protein [Chitinophaga tropicalis]